MGKPESVLSRSSHESEKNIEKRLSISRGRSFIRTTFKSKVNFNYTSQSSSIILYTINFSLPHLHAATNQDTPQLSPTQKSQKI